MVITLSLLLACGDPAPENNQTATPTMDPATLLTRASLDLRHRRPSPDELDAVEADPTLLSGMIDDFMQDPGFAAGMIDRYSVFYRTLIDEFPIGAYDYGLDDEAAFSAAVGQEPLRLIADIAVNDLPWTELVRADWTMSNELLGSIWPLDYPEGSSGWQRAHYTDGRPKAGVLSTNAFWWRYETSRTNKSRGRANAISRVLLCEDYLNRSISFDRSVDLSDPEVTEHATRENPGCVSCHSSLDPLGSFLGGFYFPRKSGEPEMTWYHPERVNIWRWQTGVPPGYFGQPGEDMQDLARFIADDPDFVTCAVEQNWETLLGRPAVLEDIPALNRHREAFLAGGLTARALIRSIVSDEAYGPGPSDDPRLITLKMVTPAILADEVEALTGFRMASGGYDMLSTDLVGLRVLAGGTDGQYVTVPSDRPTATTVMVQERLAQAAAYHLIEYERAHPSAPRLLTVNPDETPTAEALDAQIADLHRRILSRRATDEELAELADLYAEVSALAGPAAGWQSVLTVLMRDPSFILY